MNIDKTDLSKKALIVISTLGVTVSAPYVAPFVIPFIAPLVIDCLKAVGQGVLPNITASALWEIKDSFQPTQENHDLSRLLANAYSQAIDQLLQEVEEHNEYENFREVATLALPRIKKRIDRALKKDTADELTKLFPSKEFFEKQRTSAQEPQKAPFFLRWFGYKKTPKTPIDKEFANQSSAEDFILSIAEDSATAKQLITDEIEISLRRWFKEENRGMEKFPDPLTPFVFEKLAEIIPKRIGELVKTSKHEHSWIAFQRSYLQALFKEVKNNKRLSERTVELLLPLAKELDKLSKLEGVPEELAELSQICLFGFDKLETVIEANRTKIIEAVNEGERRLSQGIEELKKQNEELKENFIKGNLSLEEIKLNLENQTRSLEILSGKFGDVEDFKILANDIKLLSEEIKSSGKSRHEDCLKPLLPDFKPSESKGVRRFSYYNILDAFAGRDDVVNRLLGGFLAAPNSQSPKFQFCYVSGQGGVGKSRLALELVRKVKQEWPLSGIIPHDETKGAIECLRSKDWTPPEPTFAVIDYATEAVENIRTLLTSLARRRKDFLHPLRLMLLARSSEQDLMDKLISKGSEGVPVEECALNEPLTGLNPASCIEIMRGRIESAGGDKKTFNDEELDKILVSIDQGRRPLWAAIVGELIGENAGFFSAATKPEDNELEQQKAIREILGREFERWEKQESLFGEHNQKLLRQKHERLLALATMTRGLSLQRVWSLASKIDPELLPRRGEFNSNFYAVISDHDVEPREGDGWLRPLEPDILGEGFVELLFEDQWSFEEDIKELAWHIDPAGMAQFVALFEFDFGNVRSNPLRFLPKATPDERRERLAVSRTLVSLSYIRVRRLLESERWSNPSPESSPPLGEKDRIEVGEALSRAFKTESGHPLLEDQGKNL